MIANALPRPLTAGSVDNAILRADGTGGSTLQSSGLLVEDAIVSFTGITGDAATDIITATGHNLVADQPVRFTALTGGTGLLTTTNYFVRDISGSTFKVSTTSGGAAVNFTTNITAGTLLTGHSVSTNVTLSENTTATNSDLVLTPKGTGALIAGPKPDGTTTGGNARGTNSVDLQTLRGGATQVASGANSFSCNVSNTASGQQSFSSGGQNIASNLQAACLGGQDNTASADKSTVINGRAQTATAVGAIVVGGGNGGATGGNTASATSAATLGGMQALANRYSMHAHSAGMFAAQGDAQRARFVLRNKTTTNAAVELFLDGSSTRLTIPSGKSVGGTIQISGVTSGGETANLYIRQFLIRNRGGTTALIGSIQTVGTDIEGITAADVTLTADDTNDALKVEVTGYTPVTAMTAAASTDVISKVAHGFSNADDIVFTTLTGGAGLTANTVTYWVIDATADTFKVSATRGGAAVNITTDYSAMTATRLIRWVANVDCTEIGHGV